MMRLSEDIDQALKQFLRQLLELISSRLRQVFSPPFFIIAVQPADAWQKRIWNECFVL